MSENTGHDAPSSAETGESAGTADGAVALRRDSIARNTIFAILVQTTTAAFTAVMSIVLIRILGPEEFGIFTLALSISGMLTVVAGFGLRGSLGRFVAESHTDPARCAVLVRDAIRLVLVTTTLATVGLFLTAPWIADAYDEPSLVWPLRGAAISLFFETLLVVYTSLFASLARIVVNLKVIFVESTVETIASIALVVGGTGATGAAFGRAAGYVVGATMAVVIAARLLGRITVAVFSLPRGPTDNTRPILRYALPLLTLDVIYGLFARIDVLLIGSLLNATAIGIYSAPKRLMPALGGVGLAVASSVAPRQARSETTEPQVDAFSRSLRGLLILYAAMTPALVVWATPIADFLFGTTYDESAEVLRWLAPFVFLTGVSPLLSLTVDYLGYARRRVPIALGALAISFGINVVFLPRIGIVAAAIASSAAYLFFVVATVRICHEALGFDARPLTLSLVRVLAAASAMGLVMVAIGGTQDLDLFTAVAGSVAGLAAYLATLVATRELTVSSIRSSVAAARRRFVRRR